jgi:hypothetical protein
MQDNRPRSPATARVGSWSHLRKCQVGGDGIAPVDLSRRSMTKVVNRIYGRGEIGQDARPEGSS